MKFINFETQRPEFNQYCWLRRVGTENPEICFYGDQGYINPNIQTEKSFHMGWFGDFEWAPLECYKDFV